MEGKLIKKDSLYILKATLPDFGEIIVANSASIIPELANFGGLSLKNCQEIERGYDLDELADFYSTMTVFFRLDEIPTEKQIEDAEYISKIAYKDGFKKALHINSGKKFTEENMKYFAGFAIGYTKNGIQPDTESVLDNKLKSLQQSEWDVTFNPDELDADGCLILKRVI